MKVTDQETGEQVSRRELARRRDARAAERQERPGSEWQPLHKRLPTEPLPPEQSPKTTGLPAPAVVKPAPQPSPRGEHGFTAEEIPQAHRDGKVHFDEHGIRDPRFKYALSSQQPAYLWKTWL